ncbi:serine-rich adhesin for platelets isoform X2 [Latimeria chalumnae]|uniref:serine-rich adhesin for platelets isoform X2 n=1 Tax=Latimeria chalumnae TaxID=7897 RepID=UPI00313C4335
MEASLTCAVCLSLLEEPTTLPVCSHNFCKTCVLECVSSSTEQQGLQYRGLEHRRLSPQVVCPLCRKVSAIPEAGVAGLPVNTTLAEVVKLFRSQNAKLKQLGQPEAGGEGDCDSQIYSSGLVYEACEKHPARIRQLFCKVCREMACGQCVSEQHTGIFHSVNLMDIVYQEEKLNFFSSIKELRKLDEELSKELSSQLSGPEVSLNDEVETVGSEFDTILKALELKKKQLLEEIEKQRNQKMKENRVLREMKESQKKILVGLLKDCEDLINECDPLNFLKVACDLNKRVLSHLELMRIAAGQEKATQSNPRQMVIKPVVDGIAALQLSKVDPSGNSGSSNTAEGPNGNFKFKVIPKSWKNQKVFQFRVFVPPRGEDEILKNGLRISTHMLVLSAMEKFKTLSLEELRYKYYDNYRDNSNCGTQAANAESDAERSVFTSSSEGAFKTFFNFGQSSVMKKETENSSKGLMAPLKKVTLMSNASDSSMDNSISGAAALESTLNADCDEREAMKTDDITSNSDMISDAQENLVAASKTVSLTLEGYAANAASTSLATTASLAKTTFSTNSTECARKPFGNTSSAFFPYSKIKSAASEAKDNNHSASVVPLFSFGQTKSSIFPTKNSDSAENSAALKMRQASKPPSANVETFGGGQDYQDQATAFQKKYNPAPLFVAAFPKTESIPGNKTRSFLKRSSKTKQKDLCGELGETLIAKPGITTTTSSAVKVASTSSSTAASSSFSFGKPVFSFSFGKSNSSTSALEGNTGSHLLASNSLFTSQEEKTDDSVRLAVAQKNETGVASNATDQNKLSAFPVSPLSCQGHSSLSSGTSSVFSGVLFGKVERENSRPFSFAPVSSSGAGSTSASSLVSLVVSATESTADSRKLLKPNDGFQLDKKEVASVTVSGIKPSHTKTNSSVLLSVPPLSQFLATPLNSECKGMVKQHASDASTEPVRGHSSSPSYRGLAASSVLPNNVVLRQQTDSAKLENSTTDACKTHTDVARSEFLPWQKSSFVENSHRFTGASIEKDGDQTSNGDEENESASSDSENASCDRVADEESILNTVEESSLLATGTDK